MKKSRLIILLAAAFIAAGAGTVFVLTQLKKPAADESVVRVLHSTPNFAQS